MTMPSETLDIALAYCRRGLKVIPVAYQKKGPHIKGWQKLRLTESDIPGHFNGQRQNIGVLLGEPSCNHIDIDLDAPDAVTLARNFLPPTGSIFGRAGKKQSHWEYIADPLEPTTKFPDIDGTMLVEFRSTGAQTIFPGSVHPSGEAVEWDKDEDPAPVDGRLLLD